MSTSKRTYLVLTRVVFAAALFLMPLFVAGCGGGTPSTAASISSTEGQRAIATSMALKAANSGGSDQSSAAPQKAGPKTVAEVMASAPMSSGLDARHLSKGVACEACHGSIPADGKPSLPSTAKCLSCHGGSYDALAAKTAALGPMNPHKAHTGKPDCDRCHGVHRPFEYSCNNCHDFPIPGKYRNGIAG
jgi:hypothetical protein